MDVWWDLLACFGGFFVVYWQEFRVNDEQQLADVKTNILAVNMFAVMFLIYRRVMLQAQRPGRRRRIASQGSDRPMYNLRVLIHKFKL